MENLVEKLVSVSRTLEKVEVHGKENMTNLLACIKYLEELAHEINSESDVSEDQPEP